MILAVWLTVLILIISIITASSKDDRIENSDKKLNLAFCLTGTTHLRCNHDVTNIINIIIIIKVN